MYRLEVTRDIAINDKQTLGKAEVLSEANVIYFKCETLELGWHNNKRQISCIPKGEYKCVKVGNTHNIPYPHISITNVLNRDGVCIHSANYYTQLLGCIAVGDSRIDLNKDGLMDIANSKKTFDKLMEQLPNEFNLTIK